MGNRIFEEAGNSYKPSERRVYSVTEITREIKIHLENRFPELWVEGEISNFKKHSSGHLYFSLKDQEAQISCVMWRGRNTSLLFQPQDGMKIIAFGDVTVYERQGKYQLDVATLRPSGLGDLQLAFEALKKKLEAEGLFDPEHKSSLPVFPERIGIVTSPTGAAIQDIVSIISRRFPAVQMILRPVKVQGEGAAEDIAEAIQEFNDYGDVDVLIVGRGGGSMEDLWAFNEEAVARAVFASHIPVVSAVGHEIDFSICDFTADLRAPTPSGAAELVVPDREELTQTLAHWRNRMVRLLHERLRRYVERIDFFQRSYAFKRPRDLIREKRLELDDLFRRCEMFTDRKIQSLKADQNKTREKLLALNPEAVLQRGYSITTRSRDGKLVFRSDELKENENVRIRFSKGSVRGRVEAVESQ
jgi:exodeoxyribonuclease VII large subunit